MKDDFVNLSQWLSVFLKHFPSGVRPGVHPGVLSGLQKGLEEVISIGEYAKVSPWIELTSAETSAVEQAAKLKELLKTVLSEERLKVFDEEFAPAARFYLELV